MYIPNLSVVCFFICLSYFIFYCALLLFCAQAWHGKTLSSRNDPIFFCSLHWRNLSLYNKITTTHFKLIRFWWKNVIKFRGKVYSNFFKFVQQLFFFSVLYQNVTSVVPCPAGISALFAINVGVYLGSALSPLLFIPCMDAATADLQAPHPWTLLYTDDILLTDSERQNLQDHTQRWKDRLDQNGLRLNIDKTEYMKSTSHRK